MKTNSKGSIGVATSLPLRPASSKYVQGLNSGRDPVDCLREYLQDNWGLTPTQSEKLVLEGPDATKKYIDCIHAAEKLGGIAREMGYIECFAQWAGGVVRKVL